MNALEGIRVLDLSSGVAGPTCTKLLADFGADVIKVEPRTGDPTRLIPPFAEGIEDPERSLIFLHLNTSKRSVTIDPSRAAGSDLLHRLALTAQIVVEDREPGALAPLGLDYASLAAERPDLIYVSITPWGRTGPYAERKLRAFCHDVRTIAGKARATGE